MDWLVKVPWKKRTKVLQDLKEAEQVLEEDHYGLEKVKERILEYLAVQQRVKELKGPIPMSASPSAPPGVGKTSLGQSIARATNRKFRANVARRRSRRGRDSRASPDLHRLDAGQDRAEHEQGQGP